MTTVRLVCAVILAATLGAATAEAQYQPPKPGPEHALLKKLEGTWDTTMKIAGQESKGTAVYKMDLGGLWLTSAFEGSMGTDKFSGRGFDTYDAGKKKFVGVWFDSMSTTPMIMEGNYSKDGKTLTMVGDGVGMDGKPAKWKSVTTMPDDDTMHMSMYVGEAKEPMFTVTYKRKK